MNNKIRCLFVGGSHDGARIEVPIHKDRIRLPIEKVAIFNSEMERSSESLEREKVYHDEVYYKMPFCADPQVFFIYVIAGMSVIEAIHRLIDNYKVTIREGR